jgi:hypothetical protein
VPLRRVGSRAAGAEGDETETNKRTQRSRPGRLESKWAGGWVGAALFYWVLDLFARVREFRKPISRWGGSPWMAAFQICFCRTEKFALQISKRNGPSWMIRL